MSKSQQTDSVSVECSQFGLRELRSLIRETLLREASRVTAATARSIYNAAKKSYDNSYAMMIDDAFKGAQRVAVKHGIDVYYDNEWFGLMFRHIKAHNSWSNISESDKKDIVVLLREQL